MLHVDLFGVLASLPVHQFMQFLLVCMAVRFGAQGSCTKVMYLGLPYRHCI